METILNESVPHVGELIFKHSSDQALLQYRLLSKFCKELAETILIERWKRHFENGSYVGSEHVPALKFLLNQQEPKNIEINARYSNGYTAFMRACVGGKVDVVKVMLESLECSERNGIDLNATDNDGKTAFMKACIDGKVEVMKLLLECTERNGIDLNATDNDGKTAYIWAMYVGHNGVIPLIMQHSRQQNIDLNALDRHGLSGLDYAFLEAMNGGSSIFASVPNNIDVNIN